MYILFIDGVYVGDNGGKSAMYSKCENCYINLVLFITSNGPVVISNYY